MNLKYILTKLIKILSLGVLLALSSCIFVKSPKPTIQSVVLSPKPSIAMANDDFLRSNSGDLAAFIPKGWFFVDVEEDLSSDVLGVAVNPDYSLCAVFSKIKENEKSDEAVTKEGVIGLANTAIAKHAQKTGNGAKLIGKPSIIEIGASKLAYFEISSNACPALSTTSIPILT